MGHLPQMLATILARTLEGQGLRSSDLGRGGRDMTRLAESSPELWRDVFQVSGEADSLALERVRSELQALVDALEIGSYEHVAEMMHGTRKWRRDP